MTRAVLCLSTIVILITSCRNGMQKQAFLAKVESQLDSLLANPKINSLSLGLVMDGKSYTFHKGRLLIGEAPTDATLYEIASLTKTFTGTLLAKAIAEKRVDIDDDVRKYLKESLPNLEYGGKPITFRHLATHQSGLPHMFPDVEGLFENPDWDTLPFKLNQIQKDFSREDFFKELAKVRLDIAPGSTFRYSNAGANLLGYILEEIYNKRFETLLIKKLFTPLDMKNSELSLAKVNRDKLAIGTNTGNVKMPTRIEKDMNAEGGIVTNTADMINYLKFHLEKENKVVKISHQHLWDGQYGDFEAGLFWQINKNGNEADRIFQNGGAFGTSSWITLVPERQIGVFIITNVAGQEIHQKLAETTEKIIALLNIR